MPPRPAAVTPSPCGPLTHSELRAHLYLHKNGYRESPGFTLPSSTAEPELKALPNLNLIVSLKGYRGALIGKRARGPVSGMRPDSGFCLTLSPISRRPGRRLSATWSVLAGAFVKGFGDYLPSIL
jgi:hypothetical protein